MPKMVVSFENTWFTYPYRQFFKSLDHCISSSESSGKNILNLSCQRPHDCLILWLNGKYQGLKTSSKYGTIGRKQGLFTNGCKKTKKFVQIVAQDKPKKLVLRMAFRDINVIVAIKSFAQKEDL